MSESQLTRQYREAPKLKSPDRLDQRVLRSARHANTTRTSTSVARKWRAPGVGMSLPALALLTVVGVGVGLLYRMENEAINPFDSSNEAQSSTLARSTKAKSTDLAKPGLKLEASAEFQSNASETDLFIARDSDAAGIDSEIMSRQAAPESVVTERLLADSVSSADSVAAKDASTDQVEPLLAEETQADENNTDVLISPQPAPLAPVTSGTEALEAPSPSMTAEAGNASRERREFRSSAVLEGARQSELAIKNRAWLESQDSEKYTIQIVTSDRVEHLNRVAASIVSPTAIVRLKNNQWVLLHGSFALLANAHRAVDSLSEAAIAGEQRIVKFGELQQAVE